MKSEPFEILRSKEPQLPVLLAVPHGGRDYSGELLDSLRDRTARYRLEDRHVDSLAYAVADLIDCPLLVAKAPRAVIDLNRAPDDIDWTMIAGDRPARSRHSLANRRARSGLGLIPRRLPGTGELWKRPLERTELDARIETIHRPYHQALSSTLERLRDHWGAALLIDLHSMPPLKKRFPEEVAAEFVIGDRFGASCDSRIVASTLRHFGATGRAVAHNRPYSGGYVLDRHGAPRRGIHALQIEVCRTAYLDSRFDEPGARMPAVARTISDLVRKLALEVSDLGRRQKLPQAAE